MSGAGTFAAVMMPLAFFSGLMASGSDLSTHNLFIDLLMGHMRRAVKSGLRTSCSPPIAYLNCVCMCMCMCMCIYQCSAINFTAWPLVLPTLLAGFQLDLYTALLLSVLCDICNTYRYNTMVHLNSHKNPALDIIFSSFPPPFLPPTHK